MPIATIELRSSVTASSGVPADHLSALVVLIASAPALTPAIARRSLTSTPVQTALPTYGPPTSLETQVNVTRWSTSGMSSRSRNERLSSWSTMPWMRRFQPSAGTSGIRNAVSTR